MLFKEIVDARTHGRRTTDAGHWRITKAHLSTSCSGELKIETVLHKTCNDAWLLYNNSVSFLIFCFVSYILHNLNLSVTGWKIHLHKWELNMGHHAHNKVALLIELPVHNKSKLNFLIGISISLQRLFKRLC